MKPLLLLDIDGALSPMIGKDEELGRDLLWVTAIEGVDPRLPQWLSELSELYELVWASFWEDGANRSFGPGVGLGELDYVSFATMGEGTWKLPSVIAYVKERRFAWVDDDLHSDAVQAFSHHASGALLLKTLPRTGITESMVEVLREFVNEDDRGVTMLHDARVRA